MRLMLMLLLAVGLHSNALAYVGPGLGAGILSVILGLLGSVVLAVIAIFWYPIKRLLRRVKSWRALAGLKPPAGPRAPGSGPDGPG